MPARPPPFRRVGATSLRGGFGRDLRRSLSRHQRMVALALLGLLVLANTHSLRRGPAGEVALLVAAHDLSAGATLRSADLLVVAFPADLVPTGALRQGAAVLSRRLSGAVRNGEPLTDVRLLGPGLLIGLSAGQVATPVRIADGGSVGLLRTGDRVDVLATSTGNGGTEAAGRVVTVATSAVVLALPDTAERGPPASSGFGSSDAAPTGYSGLTDGALVVLATSPATALALARAAVTARLSVTLVAGDAKVGG